MSTAAQSLAGVVAATSLLLGACGQKATVSNDSDAVDANSVDKVLLSAEVQAQLTKQLGKQSPPINCLRNLDSYVGATTTCLMSAPDGTYDVTVTVTKVEWTGFGNFGVGNAVFDTTVADKPNP